MADTQHKTQTVTPIGGVDSDTSNKEMQSHRARWLKNSEVVNPDGTGLIVGGSGVITPSQSTYTDFDNSLLPHIRTWRVSFAGNTYPFYSYGYSKDGQEFVTQSTFTNDTDLDNYFAGLGWTKDFNFTKTYEITTVEIWQYFSWNPAVAGFQNYATCNLISQGALVGQNFTISSYYDERLKQLFWHTYNTEDRHCYFVYDAVENTYQKIVETPLLPCDYTSRIGNNIDLVQATTSVDDTFVTRGRLTYWCSETKFPSKINVDTALSGKYFNNFPLSYTTPDEWFRAVKYPPFQRPTIDLTQPPDTSQVQNFIQRNIFQFRTRYRYDDGESSKYSPISSLAIPTISQDQTGIANFILLSNMDAGSAIVTHIEIDVRIGNLGDWYLYQTLKRSDVITNPVYNYSIPNKTFQYKFFNNRQSTVIDQTDAILNFDNSPIQAGGQEFLTNDTLLYQNVLEGYDNLPLSTIQQTNLTATYSQQYEILTFRCYITSASDTPTYTGRVQIGIFQNRGGTETLLAYQFLFVSQLSPFGNIAIAFYLFDFKAGDQYYVKVIDVATSSGDTSITIKNSVIQNVFTGSYVGVTPTGNGNFSVSNNLDQDLAIANQVITSRGDRVIFTIINSDPQNTFTLNNTTPPHTSNNTNYDTSPNSLLNPDGEHLKNGGQYQFSFKLLDEALRSTAEQTWNGLILNVPHIQDAPYGIKQTNVTFNFNGIVFPDWVKYVIISRTRNLVIQTPPAFRYIQWEINEVMFYQADGTLGNPDTEVISYVQFQIFNLGQFNTNFQNNTTTTYTWTEGDRIQFVADRGGITGQPNFYTSVIDLQLKSIDGINFTVDYNAGLVNLADFAVVEIYTPNSGVSATEIFYEISNTIPTTGVSGNNRPTITAILLNTYDSYLITRAIPADTQANTYESPSAYDTFLVPSDGEDIGRTSVVDVTAAQLWKQSLVRFSLVYNANSFINGLSTFEPDRLKLYPQSNGKITKTYALNTILTVIQEVRAQYSLINKQVISLQDGSEQMVAGSQILSDAIDVIGDYGCQNPETFIAKNGVLYYWDLNRGVIVEHVGKEQKAISANGLSAYYLQQSQLIRRTNAVNNNPLNTIQIQGGYDPRRKKFYLSSFQYVDANSWIDTSSNMTIQAKSTYAWNMNNNLWESAYGFIPEYYGYVDAGNDGNYMVSFKHGIPNFHNHALANGYLTFYGDGSDTQYIGVVFNRDARDIAETETRAVTLGQAVKNYFSVGYDSKLPNNYPSGVRYRGNAVTTSNGMTSIIPIGSFEWKEGYYFSQFFGNTSTGLSHIDGQQLKGEWCQVIFKRDTTANVANVYNEVSKFIAYFNNSEKTSP